MSGPHNANLISPWLSELPTLPQTGDEGGRGKEEEGEQEENKSEKKFQDNKSDSDVCLIKLGDEREAAQSPPFSPFTEGGCFDLEY